LGVEGEEAQPKKNGSRRYAETVLGWASEDSVGRGVYQTTLVTSLFEYVIVLFFGGWLIVEYFYNVYEQEYFGSFNPVFLIIVMMMASGYGFARLVSLVKSVAGPAKPAKSEDDY